MTQAWLEPVSRLDFPGIRFVYAGPVPGPVIQVPTWNQVPVTVPCVAVADFMFVSQVGALRF
jgi:hypothetical protein